MGNRFGRNQKRRMRQEIARLEQGIADQTVELRQTTRKLYAVKKEYTEVVSLLSRFEHSALLSTNTIEMPGADPRGAVRWQPRYRGAPHEPFDGTAISARHFQSVDMNSLHVFVERNRPELLTHVHFIVEGVGKYKGQWAYCFSDSVAKSGFSQDAWHKIFECFMDSITDTFTAVSRKGNDY